MEALRSAAAALAFFLAGAYATAQSGDLFAQSAQAVLEKSSTGRSNASRLSWLLMDARTGQLLASQWPDADKPIPVGSLTKPFIALAYSRTHTGFPRYHCAGTSTRCWLPRGHGPLGLEQAVTFSCNSYFLQLAGETSAAAMKQVALEYGLPNPLAAAAPAEWVGLDSGWGIAPLDLGRAYLRMASRPEGVLIRNGMRQAALTGTARALAAEDAIAKTGTAPCVRDCVASGDGLVVAVTPSESPRLLLLLRKRGTTGAATAAIAAGMLQSLRKDHVIEY